MVYIDAGGHILTDGDAEELHIFAASIGMKREWYQDAGRAAKHPHYDAIGAATRRRAIAAGAVQIDSREAVQIFRKKVDRQ